ncbi:lysozyme inhibitor LprI family protein [Burkholderia gladioli]|uniref:lysozyme inhibitor LprI family protein n=1 Tax=Burkholderia gladioli TaxID=28095 RepID=UPI001FC83E5B|nr:lysozyme inhibitor LprI family protein [Burkholderia gladioli]
MTHATSWTVRSHSPVSTFNRKPFSIRLSATSLDRLLLAIFRVAYTPPRNTRLEFEQSQKAWLNYRDKQCNGYLAAAASQSQGEGPALIVRDCLAELTRQRVDYLKTLLEK